MLKINRKITDDKKCHLKMLFHVKTLKSTIKIGNIYLFFIFTYYYHLKYINLIIINHHRSHSYETAGTTQTAVFWNPTTNPSLIHLYSDFPDIPQPIYLHSDFLKSQNRSIFTPIFWNPTPMPLYSDLKKKTNMLLNKIILCPQMRRPR